MHMSPNITSILLIYTGGTIGMIENPETGCFREFQSRAAEKARTGAAKFHIPYRYLPVRSSDGLFGYGPGSLAQTGAHHQ